METTRRQMITRFMMCMLLALAMFCTVFSDETYAASKKPARVSITSVKSTDHDAVRITWKKAKNAKKYQVYRATSKNGKYKRIKTTTARSFTNTKLTTGKKYYYKVRAVNGSKKGAFSAKKSAAPTLKKTTGAKTARVSAGSLKLTWKKVNGAKGYQIYRATSKNGKYTRIKTTTARTYTNGKLTTGKTYYYKVRAYKKAGGKTRYGAFSAVFSGYPLPQKVGGAKAASAGYDSIKLTWNKAAGAKGYQVYRATSKNGKYTKIKTTTARTYTDLKLTIDKSYYYKVRAYTKTGDTTRYGSFSSVFTAYPKLNTPAVTVTVNSDRNVLLSWKGIAGASGYEIYRAEAGGEYEYLYDVSETSTVDEDTTEGKKYSYKVRAYRLQQYCHVSAFSAAKSITAPAKASDTQEGSTGGSSGGEAVKPDDSGDAGETTAYGGEVREDCYLDYGIVRIYIGQKWSDSLNASINAQTGADGAVAKTATRTGTNYYDIPVTVEVYCFDTVDFDNFLYVEVANGHIVGWKTNALTTGTIGVYEGTPIKIKTQESVYANDPDINWGGFGVNVYAHTDAFGGKITDCGNVIECPYVAGDIVYGGINDIDGSGVPARAAIEEEEQIAEHIVNMYRACWGVPILQHSDLLYGNETYGTKCLAKSQADEGKVAHDGFTKGPFTGMDIGECHNYSEDCINDQVAYWAECCGVSNTYAEITIHQFYKSSAHRANMMGAFGGGQYYDEPTLLAVAGYVNPETGRMYIAFNSGCVRNDVPFAE